MKLSLPDPSVLQSMRPNSSTHRLRVLHVVGQMNPGGVETWLLQILQELNRQHIQIDFWVHNPEPGLYDAEIRALGSQIFIAPSPDHPWRYARTLYRHLTQHPPYQIVHSHVHHFSGLVLRIAQQVGVPGRIAHSHLDTSTLDQQASWKRRLYLKLCQHWIQRSATLGFSVSGLAAKALFGSQWQTDSRWQILHCGVNLQPFTTTVDRPTLRDQLQIPQEAVVLGHVGRFATQKNHRFLVEIFAQVCRQCPQAYLLLVGQGELQPEIQTLAQALKIGDRVIFAGIRRDVPQLMLGVMDIFVLPSLQEGLPLVLMEAQAAGLPCVLANTITPEVDIVPSLIHRLSLADSATAWSQAILHCLQERTLIDRTQALQSVAATSFNVRASAQALESLYHQYSVGGR